MLGKLYELVNNQIIFAEDEVIIMELAITEATAEAAPLQSNHKNMVSCEMFDVRDDADDINSGVDQAVDVAVAGNTKKAATKRRQKSVKKDSRGKKAAT